MKKLPLHIKIFIGLILGIAIGFLFKYFDIIQFVKDFIKPFGTIFINMLKMIAVPLIIVSMITGMADLKDVSKLSKLGFRTSILFLFTTVFSVSLGLVLVNIINPGSYINKDARNALLESYKDEATKRIEIATSTQENGPLQPLIDIVPENFFLALTQNTSMLQVIFFSILIGIGLISINEEKAKPVVDFFKSLNDVIMKIIEIIMQASPYGVFALMCTLIVEIPDYSVLSSLIIYAITVVIGLLILTVVFYPALIYFFAHRNPIWFMKQMLPAQLLAFSTGSSAATLPVTMECTIDKIGVDEEVASFVLPLGATVNMDGTSLYQAVAAVFIAQAMGISLDLQTQLMIVVTATLASIGTAAVPSAGMVMLVIVLGQAGIPEAGLALIFAIDTPLNMARTIPNITGDATVATIVAKSVGKLRNENL